jgi:hypothetical protein
MTKNENLKMQVLGELQAGKVGNAIQLLRESLTQVEIPQGYELIPLDQKPAAWMKVGGMKAMPALEKEAWLNTGRQFDRELVEEYTAPSHPEPVIDKSAATRIATSLGWEPKRTWQGLTDKEICPWFQENTALTNEAAMRITRAIEAKLRSKNT